MISKELKKLSRRELLDIIYLLKKNEQEQEEKIAELEAALQEKRIRLSEAGSIAEAATQITQIFSNAQETAQLYLREIAAMKEDAEKECALMLERAKEMVADILAGGEEQIAELNARYKEEYKKYLQLTGDIEKLEQLEENLPNEGTEDDEEE